MNELFRRIKYKLFEYKLNKIEDEDQLNDIAMNHPDSSYRKLAIQKVKDEDFLKIIATEDNDLWCRRSAINYIYKDKQFLISLVKDNTVKEISQEAISRLCSLLMQGYNSSERENKPYVLVNEYSKYELDEFDKIGVFNKLLSNRLFTNSMPIFKNQINMYLEQEHDEHEDPYIQHFIELANNMVKKYGKLKRIEALTHFPNFEYNFVFENETVFSGHRTDEYDIHFLRFGYVGQGPRYTYHFVQTCGFNMSEEDVSQFMPGAVAKMENDKVVVEHPEDTGIKEEMCWACGKPILGNPIVLYPPEEYGRGVDVCFDCYMKDANS